MLSTFRFYIYRFYIIKSRCGIPTCYSTHTFFHNRDVDSSVLKRFTISNVELKELGLSWGEAQASAKDRTLWRNIVVALCPTGDERG